MPNTKRLLPETAKALCDAIANGWTVKETACYTRRSIKAIQNATLRAGIALAYGGRGPKASSAKLQRTQDFFTRNNNNETTKTR